MFIEIEGLRWGENNFWTGDSKIIKMFQLEERNWCFTPSNQLKLYQGKAASLVKRHHMKRDNSLPEIWISISPQADSSLYFMTIIPLVFPHWYCLHEKVHSCSLALFLPILITLPCEGSNDEHTYWTSIYSSKANRQLWQKPGFPTNPSTTCLGRGTDTTPVCSLQDLQSYFCFLAPCGSYYTWASQDTASI